MKTNFRKKTTITKETKYNDLGLGTKTGKNGFRVLNKDGSFNVRKVNVPFYERINVFHSLINMSWPRFIAVVLIGYFLINIIFATLYTVIGVENLTGVKATSKTDEFLEAFFFSAQTITTLGYGRVAPINMLANIVAATESMLGLLGFALAIAMLYGRFSRPSAKIKYSEIAVIAPYKEINGFMFRLVNPQSNHLIEVEAKLTLSLKKEDSDLRDFYLLDLERPKIVFFPFMWTIVHPIDEKSPLFGLNNHLLYEKDPEFVIVVKGFDESSSQTVFSRSSYKSDEINWGEKFVYAVEPEGDGVVLDVGKLNETEKAELN